MKKWGETFEKKTVYLLLFLLPTQIAFHFWPTWAFVFGIRVDLLAPAIYLTDILVVILFLIKIIEQNNFFEQILEKKKLLLVVLVFAFINCIFSTSPAESVYRWLKVLEFSFVGYYFFKQGVLKFPEIIKTFFYSAVTFSLIGITQFLKGGTIGGLLYFLGERTFNTSTPGIALVSLDGVEHLRAYSTFSHPNSLAGFLGATLLFILLSGQLRKSFINFVGVVIVLICFLLTFSISAYIGIFLAFAFYLFSKNNKIFGGLTVSALFAFIVGSLFLPIASPWIIKTFPFIGQNVGQRLDLAFIAGKMISQRFWIGEGLGTFITNIPEFKGIFSYSWLLQPVHNIFLLVFSELGILGILSFCYLIYKVIINQIKNKRIYLLIPVIFIVFTGLFDHYSLTLQQNSLVLSLLIGLSLR